MSCPKLQRLETEVSVAIHDRNSFAKKLSRQRNDPSQRQLDELKRLMNEIVVSRNNRIEHETTCTDCLTPTP